MTHEPDVEARVDERPDLIQRIHDGDIGAVVELIEYACDLPAGSVKWTQGE